MAKNEKMDAIFSVYKEAFAFKNWFNWSGKVSLSDYWKVAPVGILLYLLAFFSLALPGHLLQFIFVWTIDIVSIIAVIPLLALGARRLNDTGISPLLTLVLLIPVVGTFVYYILMLQKTRIGTPPSNQILYDSEGKPVSTQQVLYDANGNQVVVPVSKKGMNPAVILLIVFVGAPVIMWLFFLVLIEIMFKSVGHF